MKDYKDYNPVIQKALLLLGSGLALGLSGNPAGYFRILKAAGKEWGDINKRALHRAIKKIYESKLVDVSRNKNGLVVLKLNKSGEEKILKYKIRNMKIPRMKKWDKKWRVVSFDIPETRRKIRDALRHQLKRLNFFEFQKSVFVFPFDCEDEMDFLIEFYGIRPCTRFMVAEFLDNEFHLKKHFGLR